MDKITTLRVTKFLVHIGIFCSAALLLSTQVRYNVVNGYFLAAIIWSMFVLCTPFIKDSYIVRFFLRLIARQQVYYTSFITWVLALLINIVAIQWHPMLYRTHFTLFMFYRILTHPNPYWSLIVICAFGSFYTAFLEYYFGNRPTWRYQLPGILATFAGFCIFFYFYWEDFIIFWNVHS